MKNPDNLYHQLMSARPGSAHALLIALGIAALAIGLRVAIGPEAAGDQFIFSYPAVILASLMLGARAGIVVMLVCFAAAWYLVIPPAYSFGVQTVAGGLTLLIYLIVTSVLIATIETMRSAIALYHDLTQSLEARVLARTAERNRVWERSHELVAIVDANGALRATNPAFRAALGIAADHRPGGAIHDLMPAEDVAALDTAMAGFAAGETLRSFDCRVCLPAGGFVHVSWNIVKDGEVFYLVGRNMTRERECDEALRRSQKMETLGQMTGGLAHDFNNLLTPIGLSLDLVRRRHADDAQTGRLLSGGVESLDRARRLVERLLSFSRKRDAIALPTQLAPVIAGIAPLLDQAVGANVRLILSLELDLPDVRLDPDELEMALLNLAVNARDAMPPAGGMLRVAALPSIGGVDIVVTDTGQGMDEPTLARAADPFFSTKPDGEGTGLGLATVRDFAQRAGGSLRIASRPNEGTSVIIALPAA